MKASLSLCLIFSLISPVVLLTCETCFTMKGTACREVVNQNCTSKTSCRSSIFSSDVFRNKKTAVKSCSSSGLCNPGYYSLTTSGGGFLNMLVDCCTTDNCNSKPLEFSSQPMEPNGLECEGCHAEGQRTCKGVEMVKCLGDQTKCISMKITYILIGLTQGRNFVTKGCATPLMCDNQKVNKNIDFDIMGVKNVQVNCTDAILSPEISILA